MPDFDEPLEPKERESSRDFAAPTHIEATTGRFMCAGDDYGVGFKVNCGTEKAQGIKSGPIPFETRCFDPNDII